jgi:hypothetical protein
MKELEIADADLFDEFCDPDHPVKVHFNDISAAAYRIKGGVEITPCTVLDTTCHLFFFFFFTIQSFYWSQNNKTRPKWNRNA